MVGISTTHSNLSKYQILSHTAYIHFYQKHMGSQFPCTPAHSYWSPFNIIVTANLIFNYLIVNIILPNSHEALFTLVLSILIPLFSGQSCSSWFTHTFAGSWISSLFMVELKR